jgi:hypothetical protein
MRKLFAFGALALLATLTACSHGGNAGSTLPAERQNASSNDAARRKMLRENAPIPSTFVAPKHPGYLPEAASVHPWQSGILEAGEAPVPGGMFDIVNQYNTMQNGQYVTVYAGSLKSTGAGIVLVVKRSRDLHTATAQTYTVAPDAVRIASAANGQLQLQTVGAQRQAIPFRMQF